MVISIEEVVPELVIPRGAFGTGFGAVVTGIVVAVPIRVASFDACLIEAIVVNHIVVGVIANPDGVARIVHKTISENAVSITHVGDVERMDKPRRARVNDVDKVIVGNDVIVGIDQADRRRTGV